MLENLSLLISFSPRNPAPATMSDLSCTRSSTSFFNDLTFAVNAALLVLAAVSAWIIRSPRSTMSPAQTQGPSSGARSHNKTFQHLVRRVMQLQAAIRGFIHTAEEARGSSFWGDVEVSGFPCQDRSYEEEEKNGKKKKKEAELAFDATFFKSQYEFTFPEKAMAAALQRPEDRSERDIRFIRSMMMGILSFRRYSTQMQHMLARVVYYRRFGRGRVIVRKGHRGDSFYFVFSGIIAVTQDQDGSSALLDPEPILLHKGASFGEVALLKGLRRNATIICMEETEFLVVDRAEFFQNKLDQELQKELKYRFQIFRSLDLFSTWSDESLETLADHCKTEECHHSQVMVTDTHETKNIIFVTKGRCEVLRLVDLSQCPSFHKWIKQHRPLMGRSCLLNQTGRIFGERRGGGISSPGDSEPPHTSNGRRIFSLEDFTSQHDKPVSSAKYPGDLMAAVYLRIDSLQQKQYFRGVDVDYIESCLEKKGRPEKDQNFSFLLPSAQREARSMVIVSQGAEVIRIKLDKFSELADFATVKKLKEKMMVYPSDNHLCRVFLEQNRWKIFKSDLVSHLSSSPKPLNPKHQPHREKPRGGHKVQSADKRGILQLGGHKRQPEKVWATTTKQKTSECHKDDDDPRKQAPIRLIHGIDVPKLCGKRIMW
ncbi:cyclic nucleotide-binding domain-containing protein 2 isoform X2 [Hyla sarda]|uniref:cyclic nucleotide-binding domain-containing protein 2 isoform X2 n=1 Tax=Hyla sarda TaxID=327740 RepID=UPI0024C26E42|nr:cyclic nucleotide-binding domain-containing protein 2 isoform X2 [Hyla sarda]